MARRNFAREDFWLGVQWCTCSNAFKRSFSSIVYVAPGAMTEIVSRGGLDCAGHPLCSDDGSMNTGGNGLWTGSSSNEQDFLLSRPVTKVDW